MLLVWLMTSKQDCLASASCTPSCCVWTPPISRYFCCKKKKKLFQKDFWYLTVRFHYALVWHFTYRHFTDHLSQPARGLSHAVSQRLHARGPCFCGQVPCPGQPGSRREIPLRRRLLCLVSAETVYSPSVCIANKVLKMSIMSMSLFVL